MINFREWVPQWMAVGLILFSVIVIQSVSGMYGVIFQHIILSNGLDVYDFGMMLRVMLVGTSCFFAIALKLKSLFSPKQAISLSLTVVLTCLLVFQHIHSMPLRLAVCIISGFFQIYGLFESLGMLKTPVSEKVNFGYFISFVFLITLGGTDVFGYAKTHFSLIFGEETVLLVTAVFLVLSFVLVQILMKHNKYAVPAVPARIWAFSLLEFFALIAFVLSALLIIFYQQENGWAHLTFQGHVFVLVAVAALSLVILVILSRLSGVSIVDKRSFFFKEAIPIGFFFLLLDFVMSAHNLLQNKLLTDYISIHQTRLVDLVGLIIGFVISISVFKKGKSQTKLLTCTAFSALLICSALMFAAANKSTMTGIVLTLSSSLFLGAGQMILFCTFNAYLMDRLQAPVYFSSMCVLGILRNCIGMPLGGAIITGILSSLQPGVSTIPTINSIFGVTMLIIIALLFMMLCSHKHRTCEASSCQG